jgi:hypothetical protein
VNPNNYDDVHKFCQKQTKYIPEFKALRVIKNSTAGAPVETEPLKRQMTVRPVFLC